MVIANESDGFLAYLLIHYIRPLPGIVLIFLFQLLIISQALRLNVLLSQLKMFQQISYLPAFVYVLLTATFPYWDVISSGLVANSLVIWILLKLLKLYDQNKPQTIEFNIGLIVGVSILLYEPIAILIPVVLFALTIIRPFKLTEWLVLLMGIVLPFYLLFAFVFLTQSDPHFRQYFPKLDWKNPLVQEYYFWLDRNWNSISDRHFLLATTTKQVYHSGKKVLGGIIAGFIADFFPTYHLFCTGLVCFGDCNYPYGMLY
jgi:hypothetical protein